MKPSFAFKFANSSTALRDIHEVRFQSRHPQVGLRQGKPIHAFHTQGMQIVGVPGELIARVGRETIASLNGGVNFGDVGKSPSGSACEAGINRSGSTRYRDADRRTRLITSVHMETPDAIYLLRIENQVYMAMPQ
jgi:hypothetical protein